MEGLGRPAQLHNAGSLAGRQMLRKSPPTLRMVDRNIEPNPGPPQPNAPNKLSGLIAAPFTPMLPDGLLNPAVVERQAVALAANGISGAFICGTTGEGLSLTTPERLQLAERWMTVAPPALQVIVHVGHNSVDESKSLAAHARKIGAHAFATLGPTFFRPANTSQLVDFCASIAAAAPDLPFYYYHMPSMTGVDVPMLEFLQLAGHRIPNLAGIKFTHENLMTYAQCLNFEGGRYNILFGRDEILLAALALGAQGAVGSTYNFLAPLFQTIMSTFQSGDLPTARSHQWSAMKIIAAMNRAGGLVAGKAMMKMVGIDCGPPRLPLRSLSTQEYEALRLELERVGFPRNAGPETGLTQQQPVPPVIPR